MTVVAAALVLVLGFHQERVRNDYVCTGCTLISNGPDGDVQPLVVVLHGDEGSPRKVGPLWTPLGENGVCRGDASAPAKSRAPHVCPSLLSPDEERRPLRVFAPQCPRSEGCKGSWWRWFGDVRWIADRIDEVSELVGVDPKRIYLAGWSGGASYLGMASPAWFPQIAALSLAGGGGPARGSCLSSAGKSCAPIHHLMGDRNPLFELAISTRDAFIACGHEVTWELVPGADHAGEWRAYSARAAEIAWWLLDHPAGCAPAAAPLNAAEPDAGIEPSSAPPSSAPSITIEAPTVVPPPRSGCSCETASPKPMGPWRWLWPGLLGMLGASRRRSVVKGSRATLRGRW